jgi:hypothetical protein
VVRWHRPLRAGSAVLGRAGGRGTAAQVDAARQRTGEVRRPRCYAGATGEAEGAPEADGGAREGEGEAEGPADCRRGCGCGFYFCPWRGCWNTLEGGGGFRGW